MKFLYKEVKIFGDESIKIDLEGTEANVLIMDSTNFSLYKSRRRFSYYGGHTRTSPVIITPPHTGRWFVVVDLGGYRGSVSASIGTV